MKILLVLISILMTACDSDKIKSLEGENKVLRARLTYCETQKDDLQSQIYDLESEKRELEEQVEDLEDDVSRLKHILLMKNIYDY